MKRLQFLGILETLLGNLSFDFRIFVQESKEMSLVAFAWAQDSMFM